MSLREEVIKQKNKQIGYHSSNEISNRELKALIKVLERKRNMTSYIFYIIGSICFLIGSLIALSKTM